ncbi:MULTISPECIES: glycosyltransferase family 4 protein [unclassified Acinetobacter]|uniref:glycosyltransferase family 4 protein n=1 Tax=unclassified Acinetobacter TaxID=196816 RepID=UPI0022AC6177|nr:MULTISPECIES: glycosyltransferase family 4 protein [unclassified Acinetobacter]WAU73837.1 glycosyltransferase family 4 protein [Acinetobacter sp. TR11]WAU76391.1 glycosyltransferase family 4 protein [Acinetobacter sp. TR3]
MKKKILFITRNLPPLIGGMERLNWHIIDELSTDHDVLLISHLDARKIVPAKVSFYGVKLNPLFFFLILAFIKTFWICLTQRPDILFAGSGLTAPITVFWAKIFRKKSLVYIHGLDIGTDNPIYNLIWVPSIRMADKIIANSTPTSNICVQKGVHQDKLEIIFPGVSFPAPNKNQNLINILKAQFQLEDKKILISVGRLTTRKGILEFIENSLSTIIQSCPNTILVIIGDTPSQSLNKNLQSKESILIAAKKYNIQNNILFTGNISDDELLSSWYYLADIHIFPVKNIPNDPEGFGMVAIEAAAHGIPTIAFATGGIVDAVKHAETGYLIKNQSYSMFNKFTIQLLQNELVLNERLCKNYAEQFSWYNLKSKLQSLMDNL